MELEMQSMASAIGVSIPVLRFLLCFVATIPVSFVWRLVPGTLTKHLYAAISGAVLSYLSFGLYSNFHFMIPMTLGYASMVLCRKYCGIFTFFAGFGYLIGCHVYYMSGDAWKEGGIDATGALMVLVLKVISCSINYNDGMLNEEKLREAQKKYRLIRCPTIFEYIGYCLCCGSHFAGPVFEMKDYLEYTEKKGVWAVSNDKKLPSTFLPTVRAIIQAAICMGLYLYLVPHFPLSRFSEPSYYELSFWHKLFYQYMSGFTARWKYYFIWSISEASIVISGFGFTGWSDSSKPQWDRAKNVDVLGVELATSAVQLPLVWNIQVSTWLRYYVYERLIQNGKKPGFLQLLGTQTISAIWHGLYPGYIIFFVQSALMIAGSRENSMDTQTRHVINYLLDMLEVKDKNELFAMPDNFQIYDYEESTKQPSNFAIIRQKHRDGMYPTMEAFEEKTTIKTSKMAPPNEDDDSEAGDEGEEDEDDEHGNTSCGGDNYANDEFWICCDICEVWFHGKCVRITPARAEHIKQYKCPACSTNK